MHRAILRSVAVGFMVMASVGLIVLPQTAGVKGAGNPTCEEHYVPVTLTNDPGATVYNVYGELCYKGTPHNKTVQLLVPGTTYTGEYWDSGFKPEVYSYVEVATMAGFATFNIDRIANGRSDKPPGEEATIEAAVLTVHQIIEQLRNGDIGGEAFGKVLIVGHSFGSILAIEVATTYPADVDGVLLTGYVHKTDFDPALVELFNSSFYFANDDPLFAGQFPNNDYFTTVPGVRDDLFYNVSNAEQGMIDHDEATKGITPLGETNAEPLFLGFLSPSPNIQVPTMLIVGENDILCTSEVFDCTDEAEMQDWEEQFFAPEACINVQTVEDAGHVFNYHLNAHDAYVDMLGWALLRVGAHSNLPAPIPCSG